MNLAEDDIEDDFHEEETSLVDLDTSERSFYAILNVPEDANDAQITQSFKSLSRKFHPDKNAENLRETANSHFRAIHQAYEVLNDPEKRAVYDTLGVEGLKSEWRVGTKHKSAAELKAEFQLLAREKQIERVDSLVRSKGDATVTINALSLFARTDYSQRWAPPTVSLQERIEAVRATAFNLRHSTQVPLTENTRLICSANILARQSNGASVSSGNLTTTLKHQYNSKIGLEASTSLLEPRSAILKANYQPNQESFYNASTTIRTLAVPPQFTFTAGREILPLLTNFVSFRSGLFTLGPWGSEYASATRQVPPSLTIGVTSRTGWSVSADTSVAQTGVNLDWGTRVLDRTVRVKVGANATIGGGSVTLSAERRIPLEANLHLGMSMGINGAVTAKIQITRLGQRIAIPIALSKEPNLPLIAAFITIPSASMIAIHHGILKPRKKRRIARKLAELREANSDTFIHQQKEAEDVVAILRQSVNKIIAAEREANGLIIQSAFYNAADDEHITPLDVTVALQSLVAKSQLIIPAGPSKSGLVGFYDPCIGEAKVLQVRYEFQGRNHYVQVEDSQSLVMPLRAHAEL